MRSLQLQTARLGPEPLHRRPTDACRRALQDRRHLSWSPTPTGTGSMVAVANGSTAATGGGARPSSTPSRGPDAAELVVAIPTGDGARALRHGDDADQSTTRMRQPIRRVELSGYVLTQDDSCDVTAGNGARRAVRAVGTAPLAWRTLGVALTSPPPPWGRRVARRQPPAVDRFRASDTADGNETASLGGCLP